jgi:Domain of unknown function (DUF5134)
MTTPAWILDILAALMLAVAAVSAARLVMRRPWQRNAVLGGPDVDVAHLLMGIAMAGSLSAALSTLPNGVWVAVFAVLTAWFGYRVLADFRAHGAHALAGGHCAPHLVHSGAMVYMFAAIAAPAAAAGSGMSGMGASGMQTLSYPTLAFAFALILIGYSAWDLDQLSSRAFAALARPAGPQAALAGGVPAGASPALAGSPAGAFSAPDSPESALATAAPPQSVTADQAAVVGTSDSSRALVLDPRVAIACRIAMGMTMAFMLLIMI